jgi:hypothetical protein
LPISTWNRDCGEWKVVTFCPFSMIHTCRISYVVIDESWIGEEEHREV